MKRLLFILLLTTILSGFTSLSISPSDASKTLTIVVPAPMYKIPTKKIVIENFIEVEMPKSIIADSILDKQISIESRWHHTVKDSTGQIVLLTSQDGAVGIAQFLPDTWRCLKAMKVIPSNYSIWNKNHQLAAHRLFMNYLVGLDYGIEYDKVRLAVAAYNTGSYRVQKAVKKYGIDWEKHLSKQTKKYLNLIIG